MQTTNTILMIRPVRFDLNEQTVASNAFQQRTRTESGETIQQAAQVEFDTFVVRLRQAGVRVLVFDDTLEPATPDSIFPNNWVSFHQSGLVYLYPMQAANRRLERRSDILTALQTDYNYTIKAQHDLSSPAESEGIFLEGTGSMVLDRQHRRAYACLSPRTHLQLLQQWCEHAGYTPIAFHAVDEQGQAIYHTNVVMCVGDRYAVVCTDAIADADERKLVTDSLEATGHEVIIITWEQMNRFAGNMLQVHNQHGEPLLVMSQQAYDALTTEQRQRLEKYNPLLYSPIPTIERYGGGSARCMMAEVFLPKS